MRKWSEYTFNMGSEIRIFSTIVGTLAKDSLTGASVYTCLAVPSVDVSIFG